MYMEFNLIEHIGEDGNFKDTFGPSAVAALGDDFKDSKVFEGIKNPSDLVSAFANTKKMVGQKLEGVIKKPGEKATDAEKAEYRKSLLAELGTPEKPEDYDFARPEKLPEGMQYDENFEAAFRQFFYEIGAPKDMVSAISNKFNEMQIANHNAYLEKQETAFRESAAELDKDWSGDKAAVNNTAAFKAIMQFGTPELQKMLKDAKISDVGNISNHDMWRKLNFSPSQRRVWANIGLAMKSGQIVSDESTDRKDNAGDKTKLASKMYDHPTSKELHQKPASA